MTDTLKATRMAVCRPLFQLFDYLAPRSARRGDRVQVSFGKSTALGLVWDEAPADPHPHPKPIDALWDEEALLPEELLRLLEFTARYYQYPLGEVIQTALPLAIRRQPELPAPRERPRPAVEPITLTPAQSEALQSLRWALAQGGVTLLDGLTGSGKSELYACCVAERLAEGGQALLLVPEIALSTLLLDIVAKRTGRRGAVYHSELGPKTKAELWQACRLGALDFIVGTRSAVFLPFADLRLLVVDEEHDLSFKQQEQLRYHGRDLAIYRARSWQIPIILGSATPSLEALHRVKSGQWACVELKERAKTSTPPRLVLDDMQNGRLGHLSLALVREMRQTLRRGQQVLLFLNRRGYARSLACADCDYRSDCPHCSTRLVAHRRRRLLRCPQCDYSEALPQRCPHCGGGQLQFVGFGTEQLEEEVRQQFPGARILRIDSDAYRTPKQFQAALDEVQRGAVDIILGTQWLAKGHHFPHLYLVAVVDADSAFFGHDYRSEERLAQLLLQVGGRAGREGEGLVWVQTRMPTHPIFAIFRQDYRATAWRLYQNREAAALPPFTAQALLELQHRDEERALGLLEQLDPSLAPELGWFGPVPAGVARRAGYYRAQILLQAPTKVELQRALPRLRAALQELAKKGGASVSIDVDPQVMD